MLFAAREYPLSKNTMKHQGNASGISVLEYHWSLGKYSWATWFHSLLQNPDCFFFGKGVKSTVLFYNHGGCKQSRVNIK